MKYIITEKQFKTAKNLIKMKEKELDEFYGEAINKKSKNDNEQTHIDKVVDMLIEAMREKNWSKVESAIFKLTRGKIYK